MRPLDLFAVMGPLTPISDLGLTRDRNALLERVNQVQGRLGGFVPPRSPVEEAHMRLGGGDLTRIRAQVSLSALESLAVHLGGLREGRKSILYVSQGPPMLRGGVRSHRRAARRHRRGQSQQRHHSHAGSAPARRGPHGQRRQRRRCRPTPAAGASG